MPVTAVTYQSQIALNSGNNTPHGAVWIQELNRVWIANNSDDSRYIYNEAGTYQSKASLPTGNTAPRGFCFVASRDEVWSLDVSSLYRIDTDGTAQGSYPLHANNRHGEGVLYFPSIDEVWVVDRVDRLWYRYRAADGTFIGTYPLNSANSDPRGAAVVEGEAWCLNGSDKKMYPYSASGVYRGTAISLDSRQSLPRAMTRVKNDLWVLDNANDNIFKYTLVGLSMSIESIDEQFITLGTTTYDLVIDITGTPDTVEATGLLEGFYQDWDATNAELHIKSAEVTRLISGVFWTIKATKGSETVTSTIAYNVVKAKPIFETLVKLYLYKNVPIHIDVLIQNMPDLLLSKALLLGLKSDLKDYGVNIHGQLPTDADFSIDQDNFTFTVPSDTGGTPQVQNYAYEIEPGTPPAIVTPTFEPKGNYAELMFTDVTHAIGYEWTLEAGADADWNFFSSTRPMIDPGRIEVTPGNLNVTITFPNISGASSYEYMLLSEDHEVDWTPFVGTLSNQMITTIIPDLQDGVTYTLRLRVASPWIGTPISITVRGGRALYTVYDKDANSVLYVTHTGQPENEYNFVASTIHRFFLPTGLTDPKGLAIDGNTVYCVHNKTEIWVFSLDTAYDQRATLIRKFNLPSTGDVTAIAFFDGKLYIYAYITSTQSGIRSGQLYTVNANTANAANASAIDVYVWSPGINQPKAVSVSDDFIFILSGNTTNTTMVRTAERVPLDYSSVSHSGRSFTGLSAIISKGAVLGNRVYALTTSNNNRSLRILDRSSTSGSSVVKTYLLPLGHPAGLDVSK